jgi:hypothetical protein
MKTYIPKTPCIYGHRLRYISNGQCVECKKKENKKWADNNRERIKILSAKWYKNNVEHKRKLSAKRQKDKKEDIKHTKRVWYAANKARHRALVVKRRIQQARATPVGLTVEEKLKIAAVYSAAEQRTQKTGVLHHVDHIVPLQGKTVCGLHVSWNLRVIPATDNRLKSNRVEFV